MSRSLGAKPAKIRKRWHPLHPLGLTTFSVSHDLKDDLIVLLSKFYCHDA